MRKISDVPGGAPNPRLQTFTFTSSRERHVAIRQPWLESGWTLEPVELSNEWIMVDPLRDWMFDDVDTTSHLQMALARQLQTMSRAGSVYWVDMLLEWEGKPPSPFSYTLLDLILTPEAEAEAWLASTRRGLRALDGDDSSSALHRWSVSASGAVFGLVGTVEDLLMGDQESEEVWWATCLLELALELEFGSELTVVELSRRISGHRHPFESNLRAASESLKADGETIEVDFEAWSAAVDAQILEQLGAAAEAYEANDRKQARAALTQAAETLSAAQRLTVVTDDAGAISTDQYAQGSLVSVLPSLFRSDLARAVPCVAAMAGLLVSSEHRMAPWWDGVDVSDLLALSRSVLESVDGRETHQRMAELLAALSSTMDHRHADGSLQYAGLQHWVCALEPQEVRREADLAFELKDFDRAVILYDFCIDYLLDEPIDTEQWEGVMLRFLLSEASVGRLSKLSVQAGDDLDSIGRLMAAVVDEAGRLGLESLRFQALGAIGHVAQLQGRVQDAEELWSAAVSAGSTDPVTFERLAMLLEHSARYAEAIAVCGLGAERASTSSERFQLQKRSARCSKRLGLEAPAFSSWTLVRGETGIERLWEVDARFGGAGGGLFSTDIGLYKIALTYHANEQVSIRGTVYEKAAGEILRTRLLKNALQPAGRSPQYQCQVARNGFVAIAPRGFKAGEPGSVFFLDPELRILGRQDVVVEGWNKVAQSPVQIDNEWWIAVGDTLYVFQLDGAFSFKLQLPSPWHLDPGARVFVASELVLINQWALSHQGVPMWTFVEPKGSSGTRFIRPVFASPGSVVYCTRTDMTQPRSRTEQHKTDSQYRLQSLDLRGNFIEQASFSAQAGWRDEFFIVGGGEFALIHTYENSVILRKWQDAANVEVPKVRVLDDFRSTYRWRFQLWPGFAVVGLSGPEVTVITDHDDVSVLSATSLVRSVAVDGAQLYCLTSDRLTAFGAHDP